MLIVQMLALLDAMPWSAVWGVLQPVLAGLIVVGLGWFARELRTNSQITQKTALIVFGPNGDDGLKRDTEHLENFKGAADTLLVKHEMRLNEVDTRLAGHDAALDSLGQRPRRRTPPGGF